MVSTTYKTINGRKYLYAEYSFRLPDGKVKKISKRINKETDKNSKEVKKYFLKKQTDFYQKYAIQKYNVDTIDLTLEEFDSLPNEILKLNT